MRVNAIDGYRDAIERLHAALDASCIVGVWEWDHVRGLVVYDEGAAGLLTGDAELAEREIGGLIAIATVHPDDQDRLINHMQQAVRRGGLVLAEYRVLTRDGGTRWLLSRGRTYQDEAERPLRSRGILIDITETRDGGERYVLGQNAAPADPLEHAADLAIALQRTLGADAPSEVRLLTDMILMRLGRAIAGGAQEALSEGAQSAGLGGPSRPRTR